MNDDEPVPLHAFGGYGIELEYMIVGRDSLSVLPIADRLLHGVPSTELTLPSDNEKTTFYERGSFTQSERTFRVYYGTPNDL